MTNEELMTPRFKVIRDYPNSLFKIDEILTGDERIYCDENSKRYSDFPNIFKPLEWWEERNLEDLPKYLKTDVYGVDLFRKVEEYFYKPCNNVDLCFKAYHLGELRTYLIEIFKPSFEEEYLKHFETKK